jgi:hypothetical protein
VTKKKKRTPTAAGAESKAISFDLLDTPIPIVPPPGPPPAATISQVVTTDSTDKEDLVILSTITTSTIDSEPTPSKGANVAASIQMDSSSGESSGDGETGNSQDQTVNAPVPGTQGNWVNIKSESQAPSNEISETAAGATN